MKFSVVIPVHNEEQFLSLVLPSVFRLKPDDVVLLFDRCSDGSLKLAKDLSARYHMLAVTQFVLVDEPSDYRFRFAFLRNFGCSLARYNVVVVSAADLILDQKIRDYVGLIGKYGLISFEHKELNWRHMIKRLLARVLPFDWLGSVRVFDRRLLRFEDLDELKTLESEDTHLADSIRPHARTLYVMSNTVHLRPREDSLRHYRRGRLYAHYGRSFLLALGCTLCTLRFGLLKGYIHERFGQVE